ncbi:hypothetical protein RRG08_047313 [Elysia crispata]|uniref:Uncharacterized protein n=1 Tax=Elysia crispata TaxID=231223 RepID=A0AAE1CV51_9GAST|nr:hypothetical protein RRG08_047313 [Elysia crispata]
MTAASLRDTERIISPYSPSIHPQSLDQFRVNNDGFFTQNHTENHISLLSLHTPQSLDQFRVNNDGCFTQMSHRESYLPTLAPYPLVNRPV